MPLALKPPSQLYFGKSAEQLTLAESAILAATSETPALNPLDAPQVALQRGREVIYILNGLGIVSDEATGLALAETPKIQPAPPDSAQCCSCFRQHGPRPGRVANSA